MNQRLNHFVQVDTKDLGETWDSDKLYEIMNNLGFVKHKSDLTESNALKKY